MSFTKGVKRQSTTVDSTADKSGELQRHETLSSLALDPQKKDKQAVLQILCYRETLGICLGRSFARTLSAQEVYIGTLTLLPVTRSGDEH